MRGFGVRVPVGPHKERHPQGCLLFELTNKKYVLLLKSMVAFMFINGEFVQLPAGFRTVSEKGEVAISPLPLCIAVEKDPKI